MRGRGTALSWSGGKDSALAFWVLREELGIEPAALFTTVTEDYGRVSMHGVRRELVRAQAEAAGVPLVEVGIPAACPNEVYEQRIGAALRSPPLAELPVVAFADLYLEDIRAYREERLRSTGREALFPLWGHDTRTVARYFVAAGFAATVCCLDPAQLDRSFAGRRFDSAFLADLPDSVDPCGENGEFHTFVHAGPIFDAPIAVEVGAIEERDGFVFADLLAARSVRMSPMSSPSLRFDPIAEARRHWEERWSEDAAREMVAVTSIMRVHQILMARLNEVLEPFELTFPRYEALMLLHLSRRGSLPLGKIGERLQVHRTSVTNTIDGLERAGLVRRSPHESDRRAVLAEILPAGRERAEAATEALNAAGFATEPLSDEDLDELARLLRTLRVAAGDFPPE